jgi:ABC-type sugar transport system permease subunit
VTAVKEWVGLANYRELIGDNLFWLSLQHTVIWVIVGTIAPIAIGMLLALLLWRRPKGFTVFRTFFFMPQVLSTVVIGIIWNWIYNPIFGILNEALDAVGLEDVSRGWIGDPDVALYAVLVAAIWATIGLCFVIFLAGLQNVSKDLLEAATVDGANTWQRFWNVTVPQMASVINVVIALLLIWGFSVFDVIFVMTGGGPANATEVLATYTYKEAFTQNNVGYASTLSVVITVISLIASVTFIRLRERQEA